MDIRVESYTDHRGMQSVRRIWLDGRVVQVEILDSWYGPDYRYFKVKGDDSNHYILRFDENDGKWELTMFESERGREVASRSRSEWEARCGRT